MTTARAIISGALRFHLNRLSPGETLDADLADVCLEALNSIVDEMSGGKSAMFQEILLESQNINGRVGDITLDWQGLLSPGVQIHGASWYNGSQNIMLDELTVGQYQAILDKQTPGDPRYWMYDGANTLYFWPIINDSPITLHVFNNIEDFADLDTEYVMPRGYLAAFQALLAERMAPALIGDVTPSIARAVRKARLKFLSALEPAIIGPHRHPGNILTGF